jgi:DNA-binding SARP family transcriptional activator
VGACRLLFLGPPLLKRVSQVEPIRLRKGLALAAYLAVERRAFSREHLAALLWPDLAPRSALANLRRMLTYLREEIDGQSIRTSGDLVQLDLARIDVDIVEFESLLQGDAPGSRLESLERAAALCRGGFLEGFALGDCPAFDDWQDSVQRRMEEQLDELLENLCREYLLAERGKSALPFAQRWLGLDRLNESAHRILMEIHARTGRADLARKQYESCIRMLSQEGIEPERETRDLYEAIIRHRLGPAPTGSTGRTPHRRRWPWICAIAGGILVVAAAAATYLARGSIFPHDLSVSFVETVLRHAELAGLRLALRNDGTSLPSVGYEVAFSSNREVVAQRDYVVFEDEVPVGRNAERVVEIDRWNDIEAYIKAHNVRIPPGEYSLTVIVNPAESIREESVLNNRLENGSLFFYPGTAPEAAFVLDVAYHGSGILDADHPLKIFIGDTSEIISREQQWARFVVSRKGTYFLPVDDVPVRAADGSGYVMVVIYDANNDLERPSYPGSGDISAIYREGTTNLLYGVYNSASGTAIYPGRRYRIDFSPPALPGADTYEVDDHKEIGTVIDSGALPIRQHHTFHDEGTGDTDEDWFQIKLKPGEAITVETYDAGGPWGCDTAIDIADARRYLLTANDKSEQDFYSRLTYTNETETEQVYYFQVKPYPKYNPGINRFADYIVEFRR